MKPTPGISRIGLLLLAALLSSCAGVTRPGPSGQQPINSDVLIAGLIPDIEALYLSWHELDQIYKEIKTLERGFLFDPDEWQLGYIQKVGLYIQDASVRIYHQWERLSTIDYIRPEMLRDYLTLSVKGLTSAIDGMGYDARFLEIYGAYLTHDAVTGQLNRARDSMQKNSGLLKQIIEKLLPMANAPAPSKKTQRQTPPRWSTAPWPDV